MEEANIGSGSCFTWSNEADANQSIVEMRGGWEGILLVASFIFSKAWFAQEQGRLKPASGGCECPLEQ